ncbi:hypothetical protein ACT048_20460 [Ectopseudomonas khazarica]|uniref:hypothetical protein n=1 Tax=Ectopseudomonas khazarica TaxID=2502979 RepID=UPI00403437BD
MTETQAHEPRDKLTEKQMAEYLGTTARALEARRSRGQIPTGVWMKIGGRIMYSVRRYNEWQESQWLCPPELKLEMLQSESASPGTESVTPKHSLFPRRKRASQLHPVYAIK